jgi:hypothetical protein
LKLYEVKSHHLRVQAADLLGIQQHVQEVCSALAARLFDEKATPCTTGVQEVAKRVRLFATATNFESLIGAFTTMRILSHPVNYTQALAKVPCAWFLPPNCRVVCANWIMTAVLTAENRTFHSTWCFWTQRLLACDIAVGMNLADELCLV